MKTKEPAASTAFVRGKSSSRPSFVNIAMLVEAAGGFSALHRICLRRRLDSAPVYGIQPECEPGLASETALAQGLLHGTFGISGSGLVTVSVSGPGADPRLLITYSAKPSTPSCRRSASLELWRHRRDEHQGPT